MKAYKINLSMLEGEAREDVSATIQRHAFRLGYAWQYGGKKVQLEYCPVLCFEADGRILKGECADSFRVWSNPEISAADFLALTPEDVKDAPEFRPFDKVLVRDDDYDIWKANIFGHVQEGEPEYKYKCVFTYWKQCIPYEGNEHLLGTTEDVK